MASETRNSPEDTCILPLDIVETILARLPVKSLLRFKTVSKSWNAIVSDTRFQASKNSFSQDDIFLTWAKTTESSVSADFYLIKFENQKFVIESVLGNPFAWSWTAIPVYFCNGTMILRNTNNKFELWNPSIRKYTPIWCPYMLYHDCIYGLYHEPTVDDYKVAIINREFYAVFSCKNKIWSKKISLPLTSKKHDGIFFDGSFYCLFFPEREIQYFDFRADEWKKLRLPDNMKANNMLYNLIILSRRLCLYGLNTERTKLQVWAMENHGDQTSWMELMNMDNSQVPPNIKFRRPLCLTNENDVVISLSSSAFIIYNCCEKSFGEIQTFPGGLCYYDLQLFPYLDSLFFPIHNIRPKRKRIANRWLKINE